MIAQTKHAKKGTQNSVEVFPNTKYVDVAKYVHREDPNPLSKIIEAMTMLLMKYEQDIIHLVEEVEALKLSNERMTNEASQKDDKDINAMEKTEPKKDIENI